MLGSMSTAAGKASGASDSGNQTRAESVPAIERASNRSWSDWLALFDAAGAASLPHPEIARIARAAMPGTLKNPDWWAQGTAIAFEQHVGIRVPGSHRPVSIGLVRAARWPAIAMSR